MNRTSSLLYLNTSSHVFILIYWSCESCELIAEEKPSCFTRKHANFMTSKFIFDSNTCTSAFFRHTVMSTDYSDATQPIRYSNLQFSIQKLQLRAKRAKSCVNFSFHVDFCSAAEMVRTLQPHQIKLESNRL